jgi:hypothetical protein
MKLAPLIAAGCPGEIDSDGSINAGAQNPPGNWASARFNLPALIRERIPRVGKHETTILRTTMPSCRASAKRLS